MAALLRSSSAHDKGSFLGILRVLCCIAKSRLISKDFKPLLSFTPSGCVCLSVNAIKCDSLSATQSKDDDDYSDDGPDLSKFINFH